MKQIILASMALAFVFTAHAQKNRRPSAQALFSTPVPTCCLAPTPSTDAEFLGVASTQDFGMMHLEPLAYELPDPKGNMMMFNVSDGTPGRAYSIDAKEKSNDYLIVIQEWWGLNDHIKREAEKYYDALDGKVNVLAVDLYDGKVASTRDSAMAYIQQALKSDRKSRILMGAMEHAGEGARIYSVGWCFGGMMSLQTAIMGGDKMKGAIMYYGTPEKDDDKLRQIKCDVLGIFGTKDASISNNSVDEFAEDMAEEHKTLILYRYDAVHAFANPSNPGYNKEFGDDAFTKSVAFLKERIARK